MYKMTISEFKSDLKIVTSESNRSCRFFYYGFAFVSICYYGYILNVQHVLLHFFETLLISGFIVLFSYTKIFDYFWDANKPLSAKDIEKLKKKLSESTLELIFNLYIDVDTSRSLTESDIKNLSWSYELLDDALNEKMKSDEQAVMFGQERLLSFEYGISGKKICVML